MKLSLRAAACASLCTAVFSSAITYLYADRAIFVGRCSFNGNNPLVCSCTHSALPDLPLVYREAAISWSHQSSAEYAQTIMSAAAWRVLNHSTDIDKKVVDDLRSQGLQEWIQKAAEKTGWRAAKKGLKKALGKVALPVTVGSIVYFEGKELVAANTAMQRACGTRPHYLYRSAQMQQALEETARSTWQRTREASGKTIEVTVEAGTGVWDWAKEQSRRLWPW